MEKYYILAIEKESTRAMYNLGHYYETIEKNYEEMIKYYLMALDKGNFEVYNKLYNYLKTENDSLKKRVSNMKLTISSFVLSK